MIDQTGRVALPIFDGKSSDVEQTSRRFAIDRTFDYEFRRNFPPGMKIAIGEAIAVVPLGRPGSAVELMVLDDIGVTEDGVTSVPWRPGGPDGFFKGHDCILDATDQGSCDRLAKECGYGACRAHAAMGGGFGGCNGLMCHCLLSDGRWVEDALDMQELDGTDEIECNRKADVYVEPPPPIETEPPPEGPPDGPIEDLRE